MTMQQLEDHSPATDVITVIERIPLKSQFASFVGALAAGQAYDDAARGHAHVAPGHAGHASFFFEPEGEAGNLIVLYPWFGRDNLVALLCSESNTLAGWFDIYSAGPRRVAVLDEVPVDTGTD